MEQINTIILKEAGGLQLQPNSAEKLMPKLLPAERQILQAKYSSPPFITMDARDLKLSVKKLLIRITVITGWILPEENSDILVSEFQKRLLLEYPTMNPDEIGLAFHKEASGVQDYGKFFNLNLLDEVLQPYLEKRREISRFEEQFKAVSLLENDKDMGDKTMAEWYMNTVHQISCIKNYSVEFVPLPLYDWMDKKGAIKATVPEKNQYVEKALAYRWGVLVKAATEDTTQEMKKKIAEFKKLKEIGFKKYQGPEKSRVSDLAKKMLLYDLMIADPGSTQDPKIDPGGSLCQENSKITQTDGVTPTRG